MRFFLMSQGSFSQKKFLGHIETDMKVKTEDTLFMIFFSSNFYSTYHQEPFQQVNREVEVSKVQFFMISPHLQYSQEQQQWQHQQRNLYLDLQQLPPTTVS